MSGVRRSRASYCGSSRLWFDRLHPAEVPGMRVLVLDTEYVPPWKKARDAQRAAANRQRRRDLNRRRVPNWEGSRPSARVARRRRSGTPDVLVLPFTYEQLSERMSMWGGCWMCGGEADTVDHVIALARGGPHCLSNFRPACRKCNHRKAGRDWRTVREAGRRRT
jgi:5-methylcytosine-specific restriction endonuclease McrA